MKDYVALARGYAADVAAGRIAACLYVRLACQRFVDDECAQADPDFPYYLDVKAANRVCHFTELMPHVKGKWARNKERIAIQSWWAFILVSVFGWKRHSDMMRRYRRVYVEVPRKNAKSTGTAAIGNYMLTSDHEYGAEVYSGATSEKQAWEVFGPARQMVVKTPALQEASSVQVGARNLHVLETNSKFEPIVGKPGDGASPSFSITDEYHEHLTSEQYDTMVTGMGAREQPIAWVITTAGSDTAGPCYNLRQTAVDVLQRTVENPELFAIIYTIDDDDDWTDPAVLAKANPNIDVSVFREFLETEQRNAINNPFEQAKFKTKHLDVWVTAAAPYFNLELWNRLGDLSLSEAQFYGEPCFAGLDLANKLDIAAYIRMFAREVDGKVHYYIFPRFYLPQTRVEDPALRHYGGWAKAGHLIATPGDSTDYDYIEADICADADKHTLEQVGFDPHNATQLITHLQAHLGAETVVAVPQTVVHLSEPMKEVQALIVAGRIHHDGNPAMAWQIGNVTAQEDRNQNVFPRKERPEKKIDGAVALIIAMNRAILRAPAPTYELHFVG